MFPRCAYWVVLGLIAVIGLWAIRPKSGTRTIQVDGPSMAPKYLGQHDAWTCADCGFSFATDAADTTAPAICPNCGCHQPGGAVPSRQSGAQLSADFDNRRPQRWQTIVFRTPQSDRPPDVLPHAIKRVVGLPGENISLRDGDVWIDSERARKTLTEQLAMAMPVHDDQFRPRDMAQVPSAWQPSEKSTRWQLEGRAWRVTPLPGRSDNKDDWLQFTNWRRAADSSGVFESAPVMDDYAYNRGESRQLHRVNDLLLIARLNASGTGRLKFRGQVDGRDYFVEWNPSSGAGRLLTAGQTAPLKTFSTDSLDGNNELEVIFSFVDHQILLAIDGQVTLNWPVPDTMLLAPAADTRQLAIGAKDINVQISRLRVLRDVYYTAIRRPDGRWGSDKPCRLTADEYFVLGDNSPRSADSRAGWPGPGLPTRCVLATVCPK